MRQFVKDYIIVFVAIFGITVPLYYAIPPKESENAHKYEYLTKNSDGIKTLLLGHSHFSRSFNTSVLGDSIYNAALEGRVIYYDVEIAMNFFPLMNNLHTVIYPMHYSFDNAFYVWQSPDSRHTKNRIFDYKKNMKIPPPKKGISERSTI